jgi:hypothetical protein
MIIFPFRAIIISASILNKIFTLYMFIKGVTAVGTAISWSVFRSLFRFFRSPLMITDFTLELLVTIFIMAKAVEIFFRSL